MFSRMKTEYTRTAMIDNFDLSDYNQPILPLWWNWHTRQVEGLCPFGRVRSSRIGAPPTKTVTQDWVTVFVCQTPAAGAVTVQPEPGPTARFGSPRLFDSGTEQVTANNGQQRLQQFAAVKIEGNDQVVALLIQRNEIEAQRTGRGQDTQPAVGGAALDRRRDRQMRELLPFVPLDLPRVDRKLAQAVVEQDACRRRAGG